MFVSQKRASRVHFHFMGITFFLCILGLLVSPSTSQEEAELITDERFSCMVGHNYSSNWYTYSDAISEDVSKWWYYTYKTDQATEVQEVLCGGDFDACKTEILIHEREVFDTYSDAYVTYKSAEMIMSCAYIDYCYEEDVTYAYDDPNTLTYTAEDLFEYRHKQQQQ